MEVRARSLCGCTCVCVSLRVCVCVCVGLGNQVFSSDRLKPLKENQWCHKRKVSSSLLFPLSSLLLFLLFSSSLLSSPFFVPSIFLIWEVIHRPLIYTFNTPFLFFPSFAHTYLLTYAALLGQDRGVALCEMLGSILRGYPGKKTESLVTELIPDQPSLTKRAQGLFVQMKEMTSNQDQLTERAETSCAPAVCIVF